jgi:esterase/lipase superfamily enzyme
MKFFKLATILASITTPVAAQDLAISSTNEFHSITGEILTPQITNNDLTTLVNGLRLDRPINLTSSDEMLLINSFDREKVGRQLLDTFQSYSDQPTRLRDLVQSQTIPRDFGNAAIEEGFVSGDANVLRRMLVDEKSMLDGSFVGLDPSALLRLSETAPQTPEMEILRGDILLQQGDAAAALEAYSSRPTFVSDFEKALGRRGLASFFAKDNPLALELDLAEESLLLSVLSGDSYSAATVLDNLEHFPTSVTLASATNLLLQPASQEQQETARRAHIEACDDEETKLCTAFDIAYVTTRSPNEPGSDVLFGHENGPLRSGIIRTHLPVAFELAMAEGSNVLKLSCQLGRISCPRGLEQLVDEAEKPPSAIAAIPQRINDINGTIGDARAHFQKDKDVSSRALVFIHGFNTDFAEATEGLARLMITARYPSTPYLISWPSKGRKLFYWDRSLGAVGGSRVQLAYQADREAVTSSCIQIRMAIEELVKQYGPGQVDIVAHSMGNQLLWEIIQGCSDSKLPEFSAGPAKPFRTAILAAADLSLEKFRSSEATYGDLAENLVIFSSPNDVVLQASASVFNQKGLGDDYQSNVPRLGLYTLGTHQFNEEIQVVSTQSVDGTTTYAPRNHSYHINNPTVRRDISMILNDQIFHPAIRCVRGPFDGGHYLVSPNCL